MLKFGKTRQLILAIFAIAMFAQPATAASSVADKAEDARKMTVKELYPIFNNRSWIWSNGGGYFRMSKREFTAWIGGGQKAMVAKGVWYLPEDGRVCFRATWSSVEWSKLERTCFFHRTDGRNIYQRKLPKGDWYVFKHTPVKSYDEIRKLRHGDYVSLNYTRNMGLIKAGRSSNRCKKITTLHRFLTCLFKK